MLEAVANKLKPPSHQVAGHRAAEGVLGPLVDGAGRFYKPLQGDARGDAEVAFYAAFSTDPLVPDRIRRFFPAFFGTTAVPSAGCGGEHHPHLVLEDLAAGLRRPAIADVKIGACTWPPSSPTGYLWKCLKKDLETTSARLGFRISGVQVSLAAGDSDDEGKGEQVWKAGKDEMKRLATAGQVGLVLRRFVSSNPAVGEGDAPDCALAGAVYGGSGALIDQLLELKAWFEQQTRYHFFSSSVLLMYDLVERGDGAGARAAAGQVKLVDFAHVEDGEGVIDHNFLGGLCSLIKFLTEVLNDS